MTHRQKGTSVEFSTSTFTGVLEGEGGLILLEFIHCKGVATHVTTKPHHGLLVAQSAMANTYHVVDDVGKSPDHRDAEEGNAQKDHVQQANAQDIGEPDAPAVHNPGVGVHLAVSCAHVHVGSHRSQADLKLNRESHQGSVVLLSKQLVGKLHAISPFTHLSLPHYSTKSSPRQSTIF